jgi:hypothetical protein
MDRLLAKQQQQRYMAQYDEIEAMFKATEAKESLFLSLGRRLDEALSDPALPRSHRFIYHMMNVWCTPEPLPQIELARETLHNWARDLQTAGDSQEVIDGILEERRGLLAKTIEARRKEREARKKKYAALFYACKLRCR